MYIPTYRSRPGGFEFITLILSECIRSITPDIEISDITIVIRIGKNTRPGKHILQIIRHSRIYRVAIRASLGKPFQNSLIGVITQIKITILTQSR